MTDNESWYFTLDEIKNSPSSKVGIDFTTETRYRSDGTKFINKVGNQLNLKYQTLATGAVYFHRFYMHHSFKEFHKYAIGAACLFLAGKVEETPKKARDLFKQIQISQLLSEDAIPSVFGADPKESLMTLERILLKTIKFDLQVEHPYKYAIRYGKTFIGDRSKIEQVVQMAWTFLNDSLCTTLCLQWEPEIIAIALMVLACRITNYQITDWTGKPDGYKGNWWDQFVADASNELLESICHQVLDFYSDSAPALQGKPSSGAKTTADTTKRPASTDTPPQTAAKMPRTEQPLHPAAPPTVPPSAAAPAYPPHTYPAATGYPAQTVSTALPPQPAYGAPPPGYSVYGAPPPHAPPPMHAPPPGAYPPGQQPYYSQQAHAAPHAQQIYYSQAAGAAPPAPMPAAVYQQQQQMAYMQQQNQQPRARQSTLKVLTTSYQQ